MSEIDWSEKFPDMRPIKGAPGLFTMNGVGTTVCGSRDYDAETGTYVKTLCICVLFIPLLPLCSYRVADAQSGGWYFLGKVPLSPLAKFWNLGLAAFIVGLAGWGMWHAHVTSPAYVAERKLAQADELAAAGQAGKAATAYTEVMASGHSAAAARQKLVALMNQPPADLAQTAAVYQAAVAWQRRRQDVLVPKLFEQGQVLVQEHAQANPSGALAVLEAISPLAPEPAAVLPQQRQLLETLVERQPGDAELASRLAVVCEAQGAFPRCEEVLKPLTAKLGVLEGARILGRIYVSQGNYEAAYDLLKPYTAGRLLKLHAAEQGYESAIKTQRERLLADLRTGKAPGFNYQRYKAGNEALQDGMVGEYIDTRLKDNPAILNALAELEQAAGVVPVALDLGITMLHRAHGLADPKARQAELEQAEKTFLAIRGLAGGTDTFRLYLGQVYYWLGKPGDGKKLFDALLADKDRSPDILVAIGRTLREVGDVATARALLEEAHQKETDRAKKQNVAVVRSLLWTDLDDQITWLGRGNQEDPDVKASLAWARGGKALQDGQDDAAAKFFRQAIDGYGQLPVTSSTLNNAALAYFALFRVSQDRDHFARGLEMMDKAVALEPANSILLSNAAAALLETALGDIIGPAIDLKTLKEEAALDLLPFLYTDAPTSKRIIERVRTHAGVAKARSYYEKLLVLAPKRAEGYYVLAELFDDTDDAAGLRSLRQKLASAELDLTDSERRAREALAGKHAEKQRADFQTLLARQEAVVAATRAQKGLTFAVAAATLARTQITAASSVPTIDLNRAVQLTEEAHQAAPSTATHHLRVAALCARAHSTLTAQAPAYAALAKRCERSLNSSYLLGFVLTGGPGPLRELALANSDVQLAVQRSLEYGQKFGEQRGVWTWALLRAARPEEAARVATRTLADETVECKRVIDSRLTPWNGSAALGLYWLRLMAGKDAAALEELRPFAARGVPLPLEVK